MPEVHGLVLNFDNHVNVNLNFDVENNFNFNQNNIQRPALARDYIFIRKDNLLGEQEMVRVRPPKVEMDDNITSILTKAPEILGGKFLRDKELGQQTIDQIK